VPGTSHGQGARATLAVKAQNGQAARGIVFGVARPAAQIESVPTRTGRFVGTVLTVHKLSRALCP